LKVSPSSDLKYRHRAGIHPPVVSILNGQHSPDNPQLDNSDIFAMPNIHPQHRLPRILPV
jgi:hypothetical protein